MPRVISRFVSAAALVLACAACRYDIDLRTRTARNTPVEGDPAAVVDARYEVLDQDPFGDGGRSASLFVHGGELWLGPSSDGAHALRYDPAGDVVGAVSFAIVGGDGPQQNRAGSPFSSFGAEGCQPNTTACGPDNEQGPVLLSSAVVDGEETLVAAGGKGGGGMHDVYFGALDGDVGRFSALDLGAAAGTQAKGIAFVHPHDGRMTLGVRERGDAPHLVDVVHAHGATGQVDDVHMDGVASGRDVDSMVFVGDHAYVATGSGIARSESGLTSFVDVTPLAFRDTTSIDVDGASAQPLRDRAVPAMAVLDGVVVFARNTDAGPELWSCREPSCAPKDWLRVGVGGDRVTALAAAGDALVLAVDDVGGARISVSWDGASFTALDGVAGIGTRVLASTGAVIGADAWLYAVVADETGPARLVRVALPSPDAG